MSFHNPRMPWSTLEGTLTGKKHLHVVDPLAVDGDGGDSPAWSRKRQPYQAPALVRAFTYAAAVAVEPAPRACSW